MQIAFVRHGLPLRSTVDADPDLDPRGLAQAQRVPHALAPFTVSALVSSPQKRALQTAGPLAEATGHVIDVIDGFAEYDRDFPVYVPIEEARTRFPEEFARVKAGLLPASVDADAFRGRVLGAVDELVARSAPDATVVVVAHGGVINVVLESILRTERPLTFPIDYCSVTRVLFARSGDRRVAAVNETLHVWNLLDRYSVKS